MTTPQPQAPTSTHTALTSSSNPSQAGASVTFTATVSGSNGPTGTVTFKDGATTLGTGTLDTSRVATYAASGLSSGSHSITAVYGGDASNDVSTSPALAQTVNQAPAPAGPKPVSGKVFSFNVLLKSHIAQGNQSGEQVPVLSDTPDNARADLETYFGSDIANIEGPTLRSEPFVLTSGKKLAAESRPKGATL